MPTTYLGVGCCENWVWVGREQISRARLVRDKEEAVFGFCKDSQSVAAALLGSMSIEVGHSPG